MLILLSHSGALENDLFFGISFLLWNFNTIFRYNFRPFGGFERFRPQAIKGGGIPGEYLPNL